MTNHVNSCRIKTLSVSVIAAVLGLTSTVATAQPADFVTSFPAGVACDFELGLEGSGANFHSREFFDKNGNLVRLLTAGKGFALTFTNDVTGATFSTKSNGTVQHFTYNPDGSSTVVSTGHIVLILYPTDVPAGPSTTLYVGRMVITDDGFTNFVLVEHSGTATDICAALQ
jgi:hypothetical protein